MCECHLSEQNTVEPLLSDPLGGVISWLENRKFGQQNASNDRFKWIWERGFEVI